MSKRFSILLVVLTIVSGLIGGAITGRIFTPKVPTAEETKQNKVLTVEKLRIVDKDGKVGAVISIDKDSGAVHVYGKDGKSGTIMGVNEYRSYVAVSGKDGKNRAGMFVLDDEGYIQAYGKDRKSSAIMGVNEYGNGAIVLFDKNGYKLK